MARSTPKQYQAMIRKFKKEDEETATRAKRTVVALEEIGDLCTVVRKGLHMAVTVDDVRISDGRAEFLVSPPAGSGSVWVPIDAIVAFNSEVGWASKGGM